MISAIKWLLVLCLAVGGYQYWLHKKNVAIAAANEASSAENFAPVPMPDGAQPGRVMVIAAQNCPKEAAQRADRLAEALAAKGISVDRTHSIRFSFQGKAPEKTEVERLNKVMNGALPAVFVNGRAANNPSIESVLAAVR